MSADVKSIKVNGKTVKVKMTLGMLNEVCAIIGVVEMLPEALYNHEVRSDLTVALLSPRDEDGMLIEAEILSMNKIDADPDEILDLLAWAVGHAADFFLKALRRNQEVLQQRQELMVPLTPISSGGNT